MRRELGQKGPKKNRAEIMNRITLIAFVALTIIGGCGMVAGGSTVVQGAGPDDLLKMRAGPSLAFKVILGLPDGTELIRRECVTELGQLWCKVSLAVAPNVTGYVSADYLSGS